MRNSVAALAALVGLMAAPAAAENCVSIKDPTARLACFDKAAAPAQPAAKPQADNQQAAFVAAIEAARATYDKAPNDMAKGAARPARAKAICAALKRMSVSGWTGEVKQLTTNSEGRGVLSIRIAKDAYVKTWNNAISDTGDDSLIHPDSPVFKQASVLKTGQKVKFSGRFIPSQTDCVKEGSMSLHGSIDEPEFIFKFSEIGPID